MIQHDLDGEPGVPADFPLLLLGEFRKTERVPKETITLPGVTRKPSFFSKMLLVPEMATGTIGALAFCAIFKLPPLNSPM